DQIATMHMRFKYLLGTIMEYTGRERSLIGKLIVKNLNPTAEEQSRLLYLQGKIEMSWENSKIFAKQSGLHKGILGYFEDAKNHYLTLHDMIGDIIIYDP